MEYHIPYFNIKVKFPLNTCHYLLETNSFKASTSALVKV